MDKYEYKVRSEEIEKLIDEDKYAEAVSIADTIDWRRVKSITMLLRISALYRVNRRNEDSRAILLLAYDRYPTNRSVVYSLCEVSIELDDVVAAIEYYKQFVKIAPRDNGVFTLRYRILEAQEASLEERIELLEELKRRDYQEEWAYELAYLYHRVGLATKCVEECDDMILWFGDGPYVRKAMELKMLHAPLTEVQQAKYDNLDGDSGEEYTENAYYNNEENADEEFFDSTYPRENSPETGYADAAYAGEEYAQTAYPDTGCGQAGYAEDSYTGEFYVEQTYDENGYPIENYPDGYGTQDYSDTGYADAAAGDGYGYTQMTASVDMSQYNTINLQKVVAESMKELFPDEEDMQASEPVREEPGLYTQVYAMSGAHEAASAVQEAVPVAEEPSAPAVTGKVADMVTNVSEKSPDPDTGAIKKVFLPGKDARFMKEDMESEEAADVTQDSEADGSAQENPSRTGEPTEETFKPITGQMKLDDVLAEWERMKQENAQKHQEEIKQQVLTQTGKILAQFDDSLKSGILGELAQEEEKAERAAAGEEDILEVNLEDEENAAEDEDEYLVELENDEDFSAEPEEAYADEENEGYHAAEPEEDETYIEEDTEDLLTNPEEDGYGTAVSVKEADENAVPEEDEARTEEIDGGAVEAYIEEAGGNAIAVEAETAEGEDALTEDYTEPMSEIEQIVQEELGGRTAVIPQQQLSAVLAASEEYAGGFDDEETLAADAYEPASLEEEVSASEDGRTVPDKYEEQSRAGLDPEDEEMIAEMAMEDALKTQEIKMNTADLSTLSDKIVATTSKEAKGAKREEVRDFSPEEQKLFENFAVTKKIKKQIIFALEKMTLAAYTGNIIITGEAGLDTVRLAKNLLREFQETDANFSGKMAKIAGEKLNTKNLKDTFYKLGNGAIIIEKANGMTQEKLYEMTALLNQETLGIIVILTDTKKEISALLEKQAMTADYFNIRIDLIEMDNNALVAYAKNYALALEYSIDELGTLALYTRISNIQSGNHVVTKDEVRDIIDEAIWRSKKSRIKNFVDVLFSKRYDSEDMIVLKERDFM